jgi:hypothetical protein
MTLRPHETAVLRITIPEAPTSAPRKLSRSTRFAQPALVEIENAPVRLQVAGPLGAGTLERAVLRLATAGNPQAPLPKLRFNGSELAVPEAVIGDGPQRPNGDHWAVRLVTVPKDLIQTTNALELHFETPGGWVSSAALVLDETLP